MMLTTDQRFEELKRDVKQILDEADKPWPADYVEAIRRLTAISHMARNAYEYACARAEDITLDT